MGSEAFLFCMIFKIFLVYILHHYSALIKKEIKKKAAAFTLKSTKDGKNYCIITNYLQLQCCQHITVVNQGYIFKDLKSVFTNKHA